jgi:DNA polymerase
VATPSVLADGIAGMDWATLAHTVAACQACKLCTGRRAPVFGAGRTPGQADWLVVGEPPDEAEERSGTPFADQAGQLLDNMLKALAVSRSGTESTGAAAAYLTNVVKCRPATVRNPEPQELATCENYLRREVALVQPKVILAMGRFAAQTLLQGSLPEVAGIPLGKLRGQIYRYQGIPVVVTYHPTYLLRTQQDKARAWADLCLALDVMRRGE